MKQDDRDSTQQLLKAEEVAEMLRISMRMFWNLSKQQHFPRPIRISSRCARWRLTDMEAYLDSLDRQPPLQPLDPGDPEPCVEKPITEK
jgi:predicted DNA-binding transcriptional regulator AlpA